MQDVSECLSLLLDSVSEDARSLQDETSIAVVNPVITNFTFTQQEQYRQGHIFPSKIEPELFFHPIPHQCKLFQISVRQDLIKT